MSEPPVNRVIVVPDSDPVYQAYIWRQDSLTLFRLRPILAQLRDIPDQPCRLGEGCPDVGMTCIPCAIRKIKTQLFGDPPEGEPPSDQ